VADGKPLTVEEQKRVHSRLRNGDTYGQISRAVGVSENAIKKCNDRLRDFKRGLRDSPYASGHYADDVGSYMPTEEQIKAACAEIQETWTETQRASRCGENVEPVEVARISIGQRGKRVVRKNSEQR